MHTISKLARIEHTHTTYSASNAVIKWFLVVKILETEIHLFRYSAIPYSGFYCFPQLAMCTNEVATTKLY